MYPNNGIGKLPQQSQSPLLRSNMTKSGRSRQRQYKFILALPILFGMFATSHSVGAMMTEDQECKWSDEQGNEICYGTSNANDEDPSLAENESDTDYPYPYDDDYTYYFVEHPEEGEEFDVWKHGDKSEMYEELDCPSYEEEKDVRFVDTSFEKIHDEQTWTIFNKIYNEVISATQGTELEQESTIPSSFGKHGFQFPIEVKFRPGIGRGVFAKTDIPKGSLLYISTNNAAFLNGQTYRNFLKALPSRLACDVAIWAFVRWVSEESEETGEHMVCVDLDEGSFVNSSDDASEYNMALGNDEGTIYHDGTDDEKFELWYGCKMKFWASRDIKAGEEIRADYNDFAEPDGWKYLKL